MKFLFQKLVGMKSLIFSKVEIGSQLDKRHDVAEKDTLNEFLDSHHDNPKQKRHRDWGSYVPPVLEHLGIVEVYHHKGSKVRLL